MSRRRPKSEDAAVRPTRNYGAATGGAPHSHDRYPVVAIGASAGGLEAFQKFFDALPADSGMAFILVQHLDPTHPSMMVELLAKHTLMKVHQAADGMRLEPDCVYVIPPGVYLSVRDGALRLSKPRAQRGVRLPFDFLLRSLAEDLGERAICVVLSGTGADGSVGLKAVKEQCGLVIAQDPEEASHDGMPRNAIMTDAVDLVLPIAKIPEALVDYHRRSAVVRTRNGAEPEDATQDWLTQTIDLLHRQTPHDFTLYKPGTLRRRIERRMAMAEIDSDHPNRYLDILRSDPRELDRLTKDLLINVTNFFRDPDVFDFLADRIVPDLIRSQSPGKPIRIWVAGCSTGEEAYSLAMLFRERIEAEKRNVGLQVFASDVDPDAVAMAREGVYPETIEPDVSPARLARFFTKEDQTYKVSPELRASVVFTVHDILADPPFSRLDLISCRNLLIYLRPEAQARVVSLFHFALRKDGFLLLGNSEAAGNDDDCFEEVSKSARLYRHIDQKRPGERLYSVSSGGGGKDLRLLGQDEGMRRSRQATLAALCQRLVIEAHAPAAALINRKYECLYSVGPTDRYLRVVSGQPTQDIFTLARDDVRTKLRAAVHQAIKTNERVAVAGGTTSRNGEALPFDIEIRPVLNEGEELLFICFVEKPERLRKRNRRVSPQETSRVAELEQELQDTRAELLEAVRNLEDLAQEQKEINEEALSVNEEYQATNEELETSKEELQSLNEELTALNTELHEALARERTTANDLQNILYSSDVATLFLDNDLNIRFFTPAVKSLFHVIPGDVGRPIADLHSLAADGALVPDARRVLHTGAPIEHEIETGSGTWFIRRTLPYRTQDNEIGGVVVTYVDITDRKHTADALEAAKREADQANIAKSRFLAAASHDLRQPLQTLTLLQGLLAGIVEGEKARRLSARLGETVAGMSDMLNAVLDLNRIEVGAIRVEKVDFQIDDLLGRLRDEFSYHADAQGIVLRVVPCGHAVHSDPDLLEQMIRNLLSNALKYTRRGKVLVGCRRRDATLRIEVWDTGIGIPEEEMQAVFGEYHQVDNFARQSQLGLGLGLSIVQRLANLLDHRISARSRLGKGSVFAIEVPRATRDARGEPDRDEGTGKSDENSTAFAPRGTVLIVEDDPGVLEALKLALEDEGHHVVAAPDGAHALKLVADAGVRPDVIVADYNLPGGMHGLQFVAKAREHLRQEVPTIVLSGDISTAALREVAQQDCTYLSKPVKPADLAQAIQHLLPLSRPAVRSEARSLATAAGDPTSPVIYVIDDDSHVLDELRSTIEEGGFAVEAYSSAEAFLQVYRPNREACLLVDAYLPGISGLELLEQLGNAAHPPTIIMITGNGDVSMAVKAMKAGASDFIEKPISSRELVIRVGQALERSREANTLTAWQEDAANAVAKLTPRQRQVMEMVLAGHPNKNIAADLGISQRTVENHRAAVMRRTGTKSLPELVRMALAAAEYDPEASLL